MSTGDILAVSGAAFGVLGTIIAAILKYAVEKHDKEIDRRMADHEKNLVTMAADAKKTAEDDRKQLEAENRRLADDVKTLTLRNSDDARLFERKIHEAEIARIKLEGEVKLLTQTHESIDDDLTEIKQGMVPRKEWDTRMDRFEDSMNKLEGKLDNYARASRWSPPMGMSAVRSPIIPREESEMESYKPPREPRR